jgi:TRAP-type C4-dicarboxylate transport system permease small subunit
MAITAREIRIVDGLALAVSRAGVVVSVVVLVVMLAATGYDVFSRFLFDKPIAGVIEFGGAYLPAFTFLGLAMTQRLKGHIHVTFGLGLLSPRRRKVFELLGLLLSLLFVATMGWQSSSGALHAYRLGEYHWGVVGITILIWPAKVAVAVGLWMLCLEYAVDLLRTIAQLTGRLPIETAMAGVKPHV